MRFGGNGPSHNIHLHPLMKEYGAPATPYVPLLALLPEESAGKIKPDYFKCLVQCNGVPEVIGHGRKGLLTVYSLVVVSVIDGSPTRQFHVCHP